MQAHCSLMRLGHAPPNIIITRNKITLGSIKSFLTAKIRIGEWKTLKIPPTPYQKPLKNRYIPFSKRFLFRELSTDSSVVSPSSKKLLEDISMFLDEKIADQYRYITEESMLLFQPLMGTKAAPLPSTDPVLRERSLLLSRKERLDNEFWFLKKLGEIAPVGGFSEVSQEALQSACFPRTSRSSHVKTYVDPTDYDVLRVWTRGLHPSCMYPLDRSSQQRPVEATTTTTNNVSENSINGDSGPQRKRRVVLRRWLEFLTNLVGPRALALVPSDHLCYNHVLLAYRLKGDNGLFLRMLRHVPVSPTASGNVFAEGVVDMLPAHRFSGLSEGARGLVVAAGTVAAVGLGVLSPLTFLLTGFGSSASEVVLAWCLSAATTTGAIAALVALRYWKARADWSERLRKLSLVCEFNSGGFALAHFLGLAQAELFKSALLVYVLLLQPSECKTLLKRSQLEVRAESWIAKRLSPHSHINLPASTGKPASFLCRFRRREEVFSGGSGPCFDLQFDAGPALGVLRHLGLVRGSDEEGLEVTGMKPSISNAERKGTPAFLSPECEEDDLGFPRILIRQ